MLYSPFVHFFKETILANVKEKEIADAFLADRKNVSAHFIVVRKLNNFIKKIDDLMSDAIKKDGAMEESEQADFAGFRVETQAKKTYDYAHNPTYEALQLSIDADKQAQKEIVEQVHAGKIAVPFRVDYSLVIKKNENEHSAKNCGAQKITNFGY